MVLNVAYSKRRFKVPRRYEPTPTFLAHIRDMDKLKSFVSGSEAVARTLLGVLNDRLELPKGFLDKCHLTQERSTCEMTIIRNPGSAKPRPLTESQLAIGAHTDFGSLVSRHVL